MKTSTRNRILVILIVIAMSAGLIASGLYVLFGSVQNDESAAEQTGSAGTDGKETDNKNEEQSSLADARKAVTGFFGSLQDGKVEEAYSHVLDSVQDPFGLRESSQEFKKSIESEPENTRSILTDYYDYSVSQYVREYSILDSLEEDGKKIYLVHVVSTDFDGIVYPDEDEINQETQNYINEHLDELNQMVAEQSQEAADNYIRQMMQENYYSKLKDATGKARDLEVTYEVVVEEDKDGKLVITEMNPRN